MYIGERKRLSIGMELITAPSVLFLDGKTINLFIFPRDYIINNIHDLMEFLFLPFHL